MEGGYGGLIIHTQNLFFFSFSIHTDTHLGVEKKDVSVFPRAFKSLKVCGCKTTWSLTPESNIGVKGHPVMTEKKMTVIWEVASNLLLFCFMKLLDYSLVLFNRFV